MSRVIDRSVTKRIAGLELNCLLYGKVLPMKLFEGARVTSAGTPIYDSNGEVLFYRVPIAKGRTKIAYADIAADSALGSPLLAVTYGLWDMRGYINQAIAAARKRRRGVKFDSVRFVAYSYPKIAAQFLRSGEEVLMLELHTWKRVPPMRKRKPDQPPSDFERWSLIDETPAACKQKNLRALRKRLDNWKEICPPSRRSERFRPEFLRIAEFEQKFRRRIEVRIDTRELHYSPLNADHRPCYELRGQLTNVWCVAASVQMILDFYRYNYAQTRIAGDLGLGTLSNPNGLPYSRDGDVVTVLEDLTSNALDANMNTSPNWAEFRNEIRANRPLVSFIPGHSRTVAGYASIRLFAWYRYSGLLVYDPWPPTTGVITRWENFDAMTYRRTFAAAVTLV